MNPKPKVAATIIEGTANFISRTTPDKDVYVEDPVKPIAKKEDSAGRVRKKTSACFQFGSGESIYPKEMFKIKA